MEINLFQTHFAFIYVTVVSAILSPFEIEIMTVRHCTLLRPDNVLELISKESFTGD